MIFACINVTCDWPDICIVLLRWMISANLHLLFMADKQSWQEEVTFMKHNRTLASSSSKYTGRNFNPIKSNTLQYMGRNTWHGINVECWMLICCICTDLKRKISNWRDHKPSLAYIVISHHLYADSRCVVSNAVFIQSSYLIVKVENEYTERSHVIGHRNSVIVISQRWGILVSPD